MAWTKDLGSLRAGETAVVTEVEDGNDMHRRLEDIGFTGGAQVRCLFAAPSGEPRAYLVRGAVMALRHEDAARVRVRQETPWD